MDSEEEVNCGTCRHSNVNKHTGKQCPKYCFLTGYDRWQPMKTLEEALLVTGRHDLKPATKKEAILTDIDSAYAKQVGGEHYQMPIQPIEFIVENNIPYREGNAIKYICRHRNKNGKQDIEKAIHYLQMILEDYDA